jgi:hypothetical protein
MAVQDQLQLQAIRNAGARATLARDLRRVVAVDGRRPLAFWPRVPEIFKLGHVERRR